MLSVPAEGYDETSQSNRIKQLSGKAVIIIIIRHLDLIFMKYIWNLIYKFFEAYVIWFFVPLLVLQIATVNLSFYPSLAISQRDADDVQNKFAVGACSWG